MIAAMLLLVAFSACEKAIIDEDEAETSGTVVNSGDDDGYSSINSDDIISVSEFIENDLSESVYVKGYIVASCTRNIKNADFDAPFEGATALLLADSPDERDTDNVISIELKSGSKMREELNLEDHPENKGKILVVFGSRTTYLGIIGMKNISSGMYWLID